jgi:flagellar protein FliS
MTIMLGPARNAAQRYQAVKIETSSPADLVVMLYDGAIRFAREAEEAMKAKNRARAGERVGKCHAILEELLGTLDAEKAPELCDSLCALYAYCMRRLLVANTTQDPEPLAEVVELLLPLRGAWAEIAKSTR